MHHFRPMLKTNCEVTVPILHYFPPVDSLHDLDIFEQNGNKITNQPENKMNFMISYLKSWKYLLERCTAIVFLLLVIESEGTKVPEKICSKHRIVMFCCLPLFCVMRIAR